MCNQGHNTFSGALECLFPGDIERSCTTSCADSQCKMATVNVFCYDNAVVLILWLLN